MAKPHGFTDTVGKFSNTTPTKLVCMVVAASSMLSSAEGSSGRSAIPEVHDEALRTILKKFQRKQVNRFNKENSSIKELPPGYLKYSSTIKLDNPNILSVLFKFDSYAAGAATSTQIVRGCTIRKTTKKTLKLEDLFIPAVDQVAILNCSAAQILENVGVSNECLLNLVSWENQNLPEFTLSKQGIELYYNEGQLEAGAMGDREVTVPYEKVWNVLSPSTQALLSNRKTSSKSPEAGLKKENTHSELSVIAIGCLTRIISGEPDNLLAFRSRGLWYRSLGRAKEAAADEAEANKILAKQREQNKPSRSAEPQNPQNVD